MARAIDRLQAVDRLLSGARTLADLVLPPRCPACGCEDVESDNFCADCWAGIDLLGPPQCTGCGLPLAGVGAGAERAEMQCGACLADPPVHAGIFAAVRYGDLAGQMAMKLKYGRKTGLARRMARLMQRQYPDAERLADPLIVPVPLHPTRLWSRGFNQAALIGRELARLTGHELLPDALVRARRTRPLRGMNARERQAELKGAIAVHPRRRDALSGRDIVLVDDVLTSGATSMAALAALKKAGAGRVAITAFARVIG